MCLSFFLLLRVALLGRHESVLPVVNLSRRSLHRREGIEREEEGKIRGLWYYRNSFVCGWTTTSLSILVRNLLTTCPTVNRKRYTITFERGINIHRQTYTAWNWLEQENIDTSQKEEETRNVQINTRLQFCTLSLFLILISDEQPACEKPRDLDSSDDPVATHIVSNFCEASEYETMPLGRVQTLVVNSKISLLIFWYDKEVMVIALFRLIVTCKAVIKKIYIYPKIYLSPQVWRFSRVYVRNTSVRTRKNPLPSICSRKIFSSCFPKNLLLKSLSRCLRVYHSLANTFADFDRQPDH